MKDINEKLLGIALDKLKELNLDLINVESVEVSNKQYSETTTLSIEIDYI